ncbi:OLC1v1035704C1 [Oldenlandia corymbosa var. corymbosa]|uniref:type I protein arginine methyltransferase n=1 Tax=Oldenlandia corymbosa var. corymbosa TaxID=529605 RepID=A0AAV1CTP4_OLDCO|nr:OLC1v1035704C1 [Oldenlandia corymbosa var. corymbosa]
MAALEYGEADFAAVEAGSQEGSIDVEEEEEGEEDQNWEDWNAEDDEEESENSCRMLCLFCDSFYPSSNMLFEHSAATHHFDFHAIKKSLGLDFYGCFKLINYIRTQVLQNRCWCCGINCQSKRDLQLHLHEADSFNGTKWPWDIDQYLRPSMEDDPLLYNFGEDDEFDDEDASAYEEELRKEISSFERVPLSNKLGMDQLLSPQKTTLQNGDGVDSLVGDLETADSSEKLVGVSSIHLGEGSSSCKKQKDQLSLSSAKIAANEIKSINKSYFGSYSSFGIHRDMISDKVRTDAYRQAILENPSLLRGSTVMDVGCGTGILSLFASQAGASRVIAVEASNKMASIATQIAKDNGLLRSGGTDGDKNHHSGTIEVIQSMIEDLDSAKYIEPHSVDVIVSEWMGYCLLYESMLSSVLFARDKWLKPGGAILPDSATMFVAGFGKGGTCLPFWENVYGFNMSCIGKEVVEEVAQLPVVDTIDSRDIVTNTQVLQTFDLVTMKYEDMDFTATVELAPRTDSPLTCSKDLKPRSVPCHGLVLWFDTGFTQRFCKEMPTNMSTSPYTTKTHWSQTVLTFKEPIMMALGEQVDDKNGEVGSDACPALRIQSRISIVRGLEHRTIDISMEIFAIGPDGRKRNFPIQMFNLQ